MAAPSSIFEEGPESTHKGGYLLFSTSRSIRPLIQTVPPVFAGRVWIPRQQVNVKVGHALADHRRVHVLGAGHVS